MSNLGHDLLRLGPAPTVPRETAAAAVNLLLTALLVVLLVAVLDDVRAAIVLASAAVLFIAGRLAVVAYRTVKAGGRS